MRKLECHWETFPSQETWQGQMSAQRVHNKWNCASARAHTMSEHWKYAFTRSANRRRLWVHKSRTVDCAPRTCKLALALCNEHQTLIRTTTCYTTGNFCKTHHPSFENWAKRKRKATAIESTSGCCNKLLLPLQDRIDQTFRKSSCNKWKCRSILQKKNHFFF